MFYNGQVYDAYTFVSDLIKSAKKRIVLIDNYVDETVLTLVERKIPIKYTLIGAFKQETIRRENTISNFSI